MIFNSAIAAAVVVGSAIALPLNLDHGLPQLPVCSGAPTVTVTKFLPFPSHSVSHPPHSISGFPTSLPAVSSTSSVTLAPVFALPTEPPSAPAVGLPDKGSEGVPSVIVIIKEIDLELIKIEELVDVDIELIQKLIGKPNPDPEGLKNAIASLKLHLGHIVTEIVPLIEGAKDEVGALLEADLKVVMGLVAKVEAIVAKIELVLKKLLASVSAKVLVIIAAELKAVIGLVPKLTGAILGLVGNVESSLAVVGKITVTVSHVTALVASITGLLVNPVLAPVFKHAA
ncbi:hypothetical protein QBC37DRAFT_421583 [Rhypophila decipiens]|uniref:Uncharacterized protein n=1 Tax=Rhypophila decipiens TaxID=261697 RepID=A0AAN6Y7X0_9PEZI|nr:hypothetical protein QBC37DRAFT_421583 [Rhypophila decipiens]